MFDLFFHSCSVYWVDDVHDRSSVCWGVKRVVVVGSCHLWFDLVGFILACFLSFYFYFDANEQYMLTWLVLLGSM